jgi:hypothetical protein
MPGPQDPERQIKSAVITLCNQFAQESDLEEEQIISAVVKGLNEWLDDDVIEFTPDI